MKSLAWMVNGREAPAHGMLSYIYCYQHGEQPAVVCAAPKLTASARINCWLVFARCQQAFDRYRTQDRLDVSQINTRERRTLRFRFSLRLNTGRLAAMLKLTVNEQPVFFLSLSPPRDNYVQVKRFCMS